MKCVSIESVRVVAFALGIIMAASMILLFVYHITQPLPTEIKDIYLFDKANKEVFHDRGTQVSCRRDVCTWINDKYQVVYPIPEGGRAEIVPFVK